MYLNPITTIWVYKANWVNFEFFCCFSCYLEVWDWPGNAKKSPSTGFFNAFRLLQKSSVLIFVAVLWATVTAAVLAFPHVRDSRLFPGS